jgi:RNA polymerase sigma-70 factor, ECF subfamily
MSADKSKTIQLLEQWHSGDPKGLERLLEHHLTYIRRKVGERLTPFLRKKGETGDYVQDVVVQFLQNAPRFIISDAKHFRALLIRIVENSLRDEYAKFTARRREVARERPLPSDTVLYLDTPVNALRTPSKSAQRHEQEALVRLGMELLGAKDREVIVHREWDRLSFVEIGKRLIISQDAARMRYNRALEQLEERIWDLRRGKLDRALEKSKLREEP